MRRRAFVLLSLATPTLVPMLVAHVGLEQLRSVAGVAVVHVPCHGQAPAVVETLADFVAAEVSHCGAVVRAAQQRAE